MVLVVVINVEMEGATSPCTDGKTEAQNECSVVREQVVAKPGQTSHSTAKCQQISPDNGQGKDHRDQLWAISA